MSNSVKQALAAMNDNWSRSKAAYDTMYGGAKVPPSEYDAELTSAKLKVSQAGNPYILRSFTILTSGDQEGAVVSDRLMLHTDNGPVYARLFIDQCGFQQPDDMEDLEPVIEEIDNAGLKFQIKVEHNGDFVNVRINQTLDAEPAPAPATAKKTKPALEPEPEPETDNAEAAFTFLRDQGLPVKESMDLKKLIETGKQYDFDAKLLTEDEIQFVKDIGLEENLINLPAKKPAAPARAATSARPAPRKKS